MAVEPKASKPKVTDVVPPRAEEDLVGDVLEPIDGQNISRAEGRSVDELGAPSSEAPWRQEKDPSDPAWVIDVGDSPPGLASLPRVISNAYNRETSDAGASLGGNDVFEGFFTRVEENPKLNALLIFEEAERLCKQDITLYNRALAKSQAESTRYDEECGRLLLEAGELRALFTKKEEELNDLRARFETVSQEIPILLSREGLRAREIEILGLKQRMDEIASERNTLQGKLTSVERCFQDARADIAKSEADMLISLYRKDAAAANARARKRQALEDVYIRGIDLFAEIERVKILEKESTTLLSSDDGSASGSTSGSEEDEGEGEVPEEEVVDVPRVEDQAIEGRTFEGAPSGQVTPAID
ncbi:MICOS complex subunit MIC60, mitochondrial-like [Nicotiana sylvestris]|uniref:MICOS complex subunit MIC60, mitochondrial-like n=1 Tax=Nicotiana sylvestris TaxID=4096 RepID=UPI00388C5619